MAMGYTIIFLMFLFHLMIPLNSLLNGYNRLVDYVNTRYNETRSHRELILFGEGMDSIGLLVDIIMVIIIVIMGLIMFLIICWNEKSNKNQVIIISLKCECGKEIEITVPMYVNIDGDFICKNCFENKEIIAGFIATAKDYIKKFEEIIERNQAKRRINDQLDLLIDDHIEILRELRITRKPLTKERKDYFLNKLEERQEKIHEISKKVK